MKDPAADRPFRGAEVNTSVEGAARTRSTAKNTEYPTAHLQLAGSPRPWRPTALAALTIAAAIGAGFLPAAARRHRP